MQVRFKSTSQIKLEDLEKTLKSDMHVPWAMHDYFNRKCNYCGHASAGLFFCEYYGYTRVRSYCEKCLKMHGYNSIKLNEKEIFTLQLLLK